MQHISHPKNTAKTKNYQGNALVIILVMIALIAALTAVAMRSSNRTSTNMDTENARIQAEKLMRQAQGFENAVGNMMTVNQCSENEINFVNTLTTRDYTNTKAPISKKCDVFALEGAGLSYSNPNTVLLDTTRSALSDYGEWVFSATHCVLQVGSDDNDLCNDEEVALMAIVPHISLPVCLQINNLKGITNPADVPPDESFGDTSAEFVGTYAAATDPEIGEGVTGVELVKHNTGCFKESTGTWNGSYIFYHILVTR